MIHAMEDVSAYFPSGSVTGLIGESGSGKSLLGMSILGLLSGQARVMTLLKELQEKLGLSYLFISHDLDVVRWFCDEIAVMEEGKFVETGRTEDVIGHSKMEFTKKLVENFILE